VAADVLEAAVPPVAAAVAELVAEPAGELLAAPPQPARASAAASIAAALAVTGNFATGSGMVFCMSFPVPGPRCTRHGTSAGALCAANSMQFYNGQRPLLD
jgi:hypothetical protein